MLDDVRCQLTYDLLMSWSLFPNQNNVCFLIISIKYMYGTSANAGIVCDMRVRGYMCSWCKTMQSIIDLMLPRLRLAHNGDG